MTKDWKCVRVAAAAALAGMFSTPGTMASVKLRPGKYIVTITYEVQEQRQNEPRIETRCITAGDLDDPEKIFNDQENGGKCSVSNLISGDRRIRYQADCPNRVVLVEGDLGDEGFSVVRVVTPKGNRGVSLKVVERGRRAGNCSTHGGD